jgi:hypothetical protein
MGLSYKIFISGVLFLIIFSFYHDGRVTLMKIKYGERSLGNYFYMICCFFVSILILIYWIEIVGIYDFDFLT